MKRCVMALMILGMLALPGRSAEGGKVRVLATLSSYGNIAKMVGGDRVEVESIVAGNQDPHFVRPKLSYAEKLAGADLFVDTGLDLELWVPALEDAAGNKEVVSGGPGYVSMSAGLELLEIPAVKNRKNGDLHVYGNPHIYNCPYCLGQMAENVYTGLARVDPAGEDIYGKNLEKFVERANGKLYGKELVDILGGSVLNTLAAKGKLHAFLEKKSYKGRPLMDYAGGWLKQALPLRGKKVVCYHKNWSYFQRMFGIDIVEYVEPKPGIPPTPKHVKHVIDLMGKQDVKVLLGADYYDKGKMKSIAKKVGADLVMTGIAPCKKAGTGNVFQVFQKILDRLVPALAG